MKKIFGKIKLTWPLVIITSIILGFYSALMSMTPLFNDTSLTDITVSFEVWILFGIIIIMNSKSAKDSALKCFVFFLISQPIIYLLQDFFNHSQLFKTYYKYWFMWTVACLPMGFIGYYMKKNKWWGLLILTPILILLGIHINTYLSKFMFSPPRHLLTTAFCIATIIIYPLNIFKNRLIKLTGCGISIFIIVIAITLCLLKPFVYTTDILSSGERYTFDDTYKAYLVDKKYGELNIVYVDNIESFMVHAEFKKAGKTKFVLESPLGKKTTFDINIKSDSYDVEEK